MVEAFTQSELATDYYVQTVNIRCGRYENKNHLFDKFATYCGYDDSVYLCIDMINHIEGVQGQRVMPPQAGNYRSKTKDRFLPNFKF